MVHDSTAAFGTRQSWHLNEDSKTLSAALQQSLHWHQSLSLFVHGMVQFSRTQLPLVFVEDGFFVVNKSKKLICSHLKYVEWVPAGD